MGGVTLSITFENVISIPPVSIFDFRFSIFDFYSTIALNTKHTINCYQTSEIKLTYVLVYYACQRIIQTQHHSAHLVSSLSVSDRMSVVLNYKATVCVPSIKLGYRLLYILYYTVLYCWSR